MSNTDKAAVNTVLWYGVAAACDKRDQKDWNIDEKDQLFAVDSLGTPTLHDRTYTTANLKGSLLAKSSRPH